MTVALTVQDITKRFGGLTALDQVSLTLSGGQVHGLIGPNGSGKTTLMNMISGYYWPDAGRIACGDHVISGLPAQVRPALGIGRTFQKPRLLGSLSVLDNVMLGHWTACRAGFAESMFRFARVRREDRASRTRAQELLEGVGLAHAAHRLAGLLEHAEQRFLEIARGLMAHPRFLMLDEPAGGLTHGEIGHLRAVVETVRDAGVGVLLVEHHTEFVFRVSDQVTTLDLGRIIAQGPPAAVQQNPDVIRVYLEPKPPLLEVEGLTVAYGKAVAVREVSFRIGRGEFLVMLGRNGAGKSTILHAISGLVPKLSGQVRLNGGSIGDASPRAIVQRGLIQVLEGHRIFTALSVEDNLLLGVYANPGTAASRQLKLDKVYSLFPELADRRQQLASRLSGGQQQILAVGQGVIGEPQLLMLDEPSGGLAPLLIDRVLNAASALCREGVAILLVEQLAEKALTRGDNAVIVETGEIVARGTAAEIAGSEALLQNYLGVVAS